MLRRVTGMAIDLLETELANGNVSVARDVLRSAPKLNLDTIGPTSAQLVRNEIDDAEQALVMDQVMRAIADHDLRATAAQDEPDPKPRRKN